MDLPIVLAAERRWPGTGVAALVDSQAQFPPDRREHLAERCCRSAILSPTAFVVVKMHNTLETGNLNSLDFGSLKTL